MFQKSSLDNRLVGDFSARQGAAAILLVVLWGGTAMAQPPKSLEAVNAASGGATVAPDLVLTVDGHTANTVRINLK